MKVSINGHDFEGAAWDVNAGVGVMRYATEESIVSIIQEVGENNSIEVYDENDVMTAKWYNAGIINANEIRNYNEPRRIEIAFNVSILDSNAEENLKNGIDESVDGIFELAELYSELDDAHTETRRRIDLYTQSVERVSKDFDTKQEDNNEKFAEKNAQISELVAAVNSLRDDLTAVQALIDDIPTDILERFAAIDSRYNALADRVAALENK